MESDMQEIIQDNFTELEDLIEAHDNLIGELSTSITALKYNLTEHFKECNDLTTRILAEDTPNHLAYMLAMESNDYATQLRDELNYYLKDRE